MVQAFLVLENGTVLEGVSFGHDSAVLGDMVFTTCMSGYQESLTDPAYKGQILVSAFPLAGDYGVSDRYDRSGAVHAAGFIVREHSREPSDMYGGVTLDDYLRSNKVPGISGIDTRDLVAMIRSAGTIRVAIVRDEAGVDAMKKKLKEKAKDDNLVSLVSSKDVKKISSGKGTAIGIIDCGVDRGLIGDLSELYDVVIFPHDTKAADIKASGARAVIVSNGPGDPSHPGMASTVKTVKELSSSLPVIGLSLGAQIVALAFGCVTERMKFGHHGCNQPVKHGSRVHITTQNHLYTINIKSMDGTGLVADQMNVNDGTLEGFSHKELPVYGIQYYPAPPRYERDSFLYNALKKVTEAGK
ncbi:MAG: glutamine-hydrolyzing carbamoyl-phosphate synthase small subunit [Methanomassiliicoccaceae archaeon]|nr:glutamine-hydrolyzing carbamoyl-phosphate synthase small subunit [Methanomassiliicoccaceae archaeon]